MSTESSPEAWRDLAGPFLIWVLRLFPIFQTRFLKTWIQSRWFSFSEWLKKEMDTYAWFNQVIFWGYCSLRKENIFPNDSQVVPKRSWYSKEASFPVFQKALLHSVLITILNHPHNHHHKHIWILRVQKPFINRAEINSVLLHWLWKWGMKTLVHFGIQRPSLLFDKCRGLSLKSVLSPSHETALLSWSKATHLWAQRHFPQPWWFFFLNCPADFRVTPGPGTLSCS